MADRAPPRSVYESCARGCMMSWTGLKCTKTGTGGVRSWGRTSFDSCGDGPGVASEFSNKTKYCGTEARLVESWVQAMAIALRACCLQALPLHAGAGKANDIGTNGPRYRGYDSTDQGIAASVAGKWICTPSGTTIGQPVALAQEEIRQEMTQGCYVTWVDQFCKSRYSKNLDGSRDISLSCTAVAVLTGLLVRLSYAGWPSAEKLTTQVKDVPLHMRDSVSEFLTVVQGPGSDRLPLGLLRCPLDIRRGNPRTSSWQPYGLWVINVTKTAGLGDVFVRLLHDNPGNGTQ